MFRQTTRTWPSSDTSVGRQQARQLLECSSTWTMTCELNNVMPCRMDALTEDCFSPDLFGLAEHGFGHGEDTLLSRRLGSKGGLVFVSSASFLHPCTDAPKAYSTRARKMGFGTAYSRRLLNDN